MTGTDDTDRRIRGFIDRFTPDIATRAHACRAAIRARLPTALELVYDNYQALALAFASSERQKDCVLSIAVYAKVVRLFFYYGVTLPDPEGRLPGTGNQVRSLLLDGPETLADPAVEALIAAALLQGERPMPDHGAGMSIIKSVSPNQRPRRPAGA
ncbi:hypothetical protein U1839_05210 [Sphingomonas sp. RT2P30]|uniref:hypothetical protein n=1 Tax=Parasphingomonas halimpatiens TaxID=3096162 RepID=UPI002FCB243A